jgi:hypothetical protein
MYVKVRRRHHASHTYEYLDIVESHRVDGRVEQRKLGCLGRLDELDRGQVDRLIQSLRRFASPDSPMRVRPEDMEMVATREYGIAFLVHQLWSELGLDRLLPALPQGKIPIRDDLFQEAVLRMVVNRLSDPLSKHSLVDWSDEHGTLHRGWQGAVHWSHPGDLDYHHYLLAMDRLRPRQQEIEEALFARTTDLLSLPLRLCLYDLTSTYFEGEGKSELAEYGYSRDHRDDRTQVVIGLATTQEGLPITHHVFPGSTVDVTTLVLMAKELRERFGLQEPVIVGDRGMFSGDNIAELTENGQRYILALRARQQKEGELALKVAELEGLPRPHDIEAPWQWREVKLMEGVRHVVVYSAYKAVHDFEVRARRIRRALPELHALRARAVKDHLGVQPITERATRILSTHQCARYFTYQAEFGLFGFRIDRVEYGQQRQHDGIFVLETNHPELTTEEVVASYRQLMEVERAFRVLKSVIKLRPIYHHRDRRVETHIFICFLAFLVAKVIEQRLRRAKLSHSIDHVLRVLRRLQAVEYTWGQSTTVVRVTRLDDELRPILEALGARLNNPILSISQNTAA